MIKINKGFDNEREYRLSVNSIFLIDTVMSVILTNTIVKVKIQQFC